MLLKWYDNSPRSTKKGSSIVTQTPDSPWITPRREGETRPVIAVGTMNFGKRTPEAESVRIIKRAIERGLTFFDTANVYNEGESERILGRALKSRRGEIQIATKVGFNRIAGKPEGLAPERVLKALDDSLARLGTDYVDVYYLHTPDYVTPIEETLGAIEKLFEAKKIRAFSVSNFASWQILEVMSICDRRGIPRPVISQVLYNLLIRQLDLEYFKFTRRYPIHTTTYNALAGGMLSGKHEREAPIAKGSRFDNNVLYQRRYWSDRFFDLVDAFAGIARDEGMSLIDLSYAWLAGREGVDSILVGPASVEQLDAAIDGASKTVSAETRARIDDTHRAFTGTDATYAR